jgi:hypothetical protein
MSSSLLRPILSTTTSAAGEPEVYQLKLADAIPVTVRLRRNPLTFGDMRLCLMRDFQAGAISSHPVEAARAALARIDKLNLWPAYPASWKKPWGQFLLDLAPLTDEPMAILDRPGARAALRMREAHA